MARARLVSVLLCLAGVLVGMPAHAQVGPEVEDGCAESGASEAFCRGLRHFATTAGAACRVSGGADGCAFVDGREYESERVALQQRSWLGRALARQRALDDDLPLHEELWTHTHNSFNADSYGPSMYGIDPNQLYTLTDQLNSGIRAIEIDFHYAFGSLVVCHGHQFDLGVTNYHLGCSPFDPHPSERLAEIRAWMNRHPNEVLLLFVENKMDDNVAANDEAAAAIRRAFGGLLMRPSGRGCRPVPVDITRREIRQNGKRIFVVSKCGPGAWGSVAFDRERGGRWIEGGLDYGDDYPRFPCAYERSKKRFDRNWIRHFGDETGFTDGAGYFPGQSGGGDVTVEDARNMTRCGVNMIGLDQLKPFDERLAAQVWSWAPNQPSQGSCAYQARNGFFRSDDCRRARAFACQVGQRWVVTQRVGSWTDGPAACAQIDGRFAVPGNGWQNELLKAASRREAWLNYADRGRGWTPRAV